MSRTTRSLLIAALAAAVISAEFVGGKATRDALFLTALDVTALPMMLVATSLCSFLLTGLYGRGARRIAPAVLVPVASIASGALFLIEWFLKGTAPVTTAVLVYLHISVVVPILASGFWLIASERFDPRAAKRIFGKIAAAGTLGGLSGALVAERLAAVYGATSTLLFLAIFQLIAAALVRVLALSDPVMRRTTATEEPEPSFRRHARILAKAPHLRNLMALVLLGTVAAAFTDYLFKARALESFGRGDALLRFFSMYYAATSLISFALQTFGSRMILERFGLGLATASPSIALAAGSVASLITPGFGSVMVARGGEAALRGSWFRAGYELFYTPLAASERRAAKSIIDVAVDRLGDAVGGGFVRLIIDLVPAVQSPVMLIGAIACSGGAIFAASRLNRWYLRTLEASLIDQAGDIDLSITKDGATTRVLSELRRRAADDSSGDTPTPPPLDPVIDDIAVLRSTNQSAIMTILFRPDGLAGPLVPHVIPLLESETLGEYAVFALRKVAEEHVGSLTDAMTDPNQDLNVRVRLARVFSVGVSQRAADSLIYALDDERFEVRFQAVRSLASVTEKNGLIVLDRPRIERAVMNEISLFRDVAAENTPVESDDRRLAHVFALLSLILSREPLQIAYRSLHAEDHHLRGTALEYLEGVLPPTIRQNLWPFLVRPRNRINPQPLAGLMARLRRPQPAAGFSTI